MSNTRSIAALRWFLAAVVCMIGSACRESSRESGPIAPAAKVLTADEQILLDLDYYEPMYELDANKRVIRLRLTGRHLPEAIMAEIGKLTELRGIDVYGSTLNDDGLAQLKNLQQLKSIGLAATAISDKGLEHLEKLQSLQWVWLPKSRVTTEGVEKLKAARSDMNVYLQ